MQKEKNKIQTGDAYAVWKIRDFRFFMIGRFFLTFAIQMQSVVVGWQIYEHTKSPLSLGMIGLAEAIPFFIIALFAGHIADNSDRRKNIIINTVFYFISIFALFYITWQHSEIYQITGVLPIFVIIIVTGFVRGMMFPNNTGLLSQIVSRDLYANATTWNSTVWHIAAVSGPALGGLVYGFLGVNVAYLVIVISILLSLMLYFQVSSYGIVLKEKQENLTESLKTGLRFVFNNQIVLGALSLDMFAVLFGGMTAMLPVFAKEILNTGPEGLGILRAAPAVGAIVMAMILAYFPPMQNAGKMLFYSVAGFSLAVIFFAFSTNFYLSVFLLALSGMFDNVSVIIRGTIMQLFTPDEMRGRVASINSIFVGSSNEIGSFEAGLAAKIMGLVPSVVFGGAMSLLCNVFIAKKAPQLWKLNLATISDIKVK